MARFWVFETTEFSESIAGLEKKELGWIDKMRDQLVENPFAGRELRFKWFREKRFEGNRLYYIVSENQQKVLMVGYGTKKEQDRIIEQVLRDKEMHWNFIETV